MSLFTPSRKPRAGKRHLIRHVLWNALRRTCTFIGAVVLFSVLLSFIMSGLLLKGVQPDKPLPEEMVLFWRASGGLSEGTVAPSFGDPYSFLRQGNSLIDTVDALDKAARDPRVRGLVVMLSGADFNMAHLSELHDAVGKFRAAGKFAYITTLSYGETGRGLGTYYFASAFDEIWLHPVGTLSLGGVYLEMPYGRAALEKAGIGAQFYQREEYKGLFEGAGRMEMSDASREMNEAIVESLAGIFVDGIAENRKVSHEFLKAQIDKGIMTDSEALDSGLVDHLGYIETLERKVKEQVKGSPDYEGNLFVGLRHYGRKVRKEGVTPPPPPQKKDATRPHKPDIALVYVNGAIMDVPPELSSGHASAMAFLGGENMVSARQLSSVLFDIAGDDTVDAVVLRINSPGGTPTAAEMIHHAIMEIKAEGKPVIVSMGAMAASAGYWIAAPADTIFAAPGTLTGSIGVAGGKFNAEGLWDKAGINWDSVQWGANAGMMSLNRPFSENEAGRMNSLMDRTYNVFLERVAAGRGLDEQAARAVARGRAWTGQQAVGNGLVDYTGGLSSALDYAAVQTGAADRTGAFISVFPKPKKPLEQFFEILEQQVRLGHMADIQISLFSLLRPYVQDLGMMASAPAGVLSYEYNRIE